MEEQELERIIRSHRTIAIACGFCILLFGVVRVLTQPAGIDPITERIAVAAACFSYAALSYTRFVRKFPFVSITVLASIVGAFVVYLAYLSNFNANSCFTVLVAVFACALLMGASWSLVFFLGSNFAVVTALIYSTSEPEVDPLFFLSALLTVCVFTYFNQKIRLDTEFNLREATKLAEVAAKSQARFLANMSHEIRTPMNGVVGMAQLLKTTNLDNQQKDFVSTIEVSSDLLLSIINNVLEYSKTSGSDIELEQIPINVREHLSETVKMVSQSAERKGLVIELEINQATPETILGDPHRLRQVFINLINNAIKFTHEGKVKIQIFAEYVEQGCMLECEVSDTGIGISEQALESLFTEFTQADSSTTREYGGTGLGLAITKNLVKLMGGEIEVTSTSKSGSTFHFQLPFKLAANTEMLDHLTEQELAQPNRNSEQAPYEELKILLAEDNEVNQRVIAKMLQLCGLEVDIADNGLSALEAIRHTDYDLVLMDLQMPEMDGLEVTMKVREEMPEHRCKIVAVTANAFEEDRCACIAAGMNDYLAKPVQKQALAATLNRVFPDRPQFKIS